ncbi:FISUMP domain-containing protein [Fibrobacter sp. UWCM]|uniref:FISUMP domain-containing protein n=1 Tax=Fibrobacter sp. UWCM TaxID=1896208 RepID=UPI0015870146|nr:FISUMP domain-containing protein [Fibrobacter sp. UWCM]
MRKNIFMGVSALSLALCACSTQTAGTSEESEGIVALAGKGIKGAAQKGPLVKGSDVVLRETSAEGTLEPTGREFHTTTVNDKGEFQFGELDLESQYALLSAEGYYAHEYDGERSECPMRLDAVTNLNNRSTANVNILTHFEYKRVLKLVKEGVPFAEAKKQASREVLAAFGVDIDVSSAEDLNIFNTSEGDRTLFNISLLIDNTPEWTYWVDDEKEDCPKLQNYLDGFAEDFADDGELSDSIMQAIAGHAYEITRMYDRMEFIDEDDMWEKEAADPGSYDDLVVMKKEYEFSKLVLLLHLEIDACTENRWGEYTAFHKPLEVYDYQEGEQRILDSGYVLCDGYKWDIKTRGYIDSLTTMFEHENGTMIDPRDGREYKTISFEYEGKRYEWMAENLMYSVAPVTRTKGGRANLHQPGVYSWTEAMHLNEGYMTRFVREGLIDSLHQGICPDGWHVANSEEWKTLLDYVDGNPNNLLDENWRTDRETAIAKGLTGVFYNRLDFNLVPLDKQFLEAYFHTYAPRMSFQPTSPNDDVWNREFFTRDEFIDYPLTKTDFTTIEISINWNYVSDTEVQPKGFVRCVRN